MTTHPTADSSSPSDLSINDSDVAALHPEIACIEVSARRHELLQDGVRVVWRQFGDHPERPPLVLLHGGHGSWMHWLRNIEALSAHHTLLLPDLPGYLDSDTPRDPRPGETSVEPLIEALGGTLDQLVGTGATIDLGGFSFGGLVGARFAVRRGNVRKLVLLGSGGHGTMRRLNIEMINWRSAPDRAAEVAALRHNLAALMLHDPAAIDDVAFQIHDLACHGTRFRSKGVSTGGGLQAALDVLGNTEQLLIWGEFDVTADPPRVVEGLLEGHPERRARVIEGAGHWVQYERAEETNDALLGFLKKENFSNRNRF
ncbi:MAG: alpha/beta fold hydrolase [Janthinobacterium lividum]